MNTESVSLVVGKIEELIKIAGGKIEMFYPYVLKQTIMLGSISSMLLGIGVGSAIIGYFLISKAKADNEICRAIVVLGFSFISFLIACCMQPNFLVLFNPDYYAVKMLLSMLKP